MRAFIPASAARSKHGRPPGQDPAASVDPASCNLEGGRKHSVRDRHALAAGVLVVGGVLSAAMRRSHVFRTEAKARARIALAAVLRAVAWLRERAEEARAWAGGARHSAPAACAARGRSPETEETGTGSHQLDSRAVSGGPSRGCRAE